MIAAKRQRSGLSRATGRDHDEWFALLDQWGAPGRPFREITDWLETEHGLSSWWAQKLIVEYEQTRGLRPPGVRPDGTFTVSTSKTVAVPVERLYHAVTELERRERWLPGVDLRERTSRPHRAVRFDVAGDGTRVNVTFEAKDDARSVVVVEHERSPDPGEAQRAKELWRERLTVLKTQLEEN